jgi:hypothetical protein
MLWSARPMIGCSLAGSGCNPLNITPCYMLMISSCSSPQPRQTLALPDYFPDVWGSIRVRPRSAPLENFHRWFHFGPRIDVPADCTDSPDDLFPLESNHLSKKTLFGYSSYVPACLTHECSARLELLFKHSWIGTVIDEQFDWNCSSSKFTQAIILRNMLNNL